MQVLRSTSLSHRVVLWRRVAWIIDALLFLCGLILLPLGWTVLGTVCLLGSGIAYEFLPNQKQLRKHLLGEQGERAVLRVLKDLPDDYCALINYVVPGTKRGDIDLLLLGPMGIVVVEVKTYSGTILYENGGWYRVRADGARWPLKSVSAQARDGLRAVIARLMQHRAQHPPLAASYIPAEAVLVFAGDCRLNAVNPDLPTLLIDDLPLYLRRQPARLTPAQVEALMALFGVR